MLISSANRILQLLRIRGVVSHEINADEQVGIPTMITKKQKKRRWTQSGGTGTPVMVRFQPELLEALDAWCAEQLTRPSRPEAVRRIIEMGLKREATERRRPKK
jgi:hypothetical protein